MSLTYLDCICNDSNINGIQEHIHKQDSIYLDKDYVDSKTTRLDDVSKTYKDM